MNQEKNIKSKISEAFSNRANEYSFKADMQADIAEMLCNHLRENYYIGNDVKVLDVGCGTGFIAQNFLNEMNILQLDTSQKMCDIAAEFGDSVKGDMNDLPFKDNSFEVVLSSMAFQWSSDLAQTFSQCNQVLMEGGILAFTIPNSNSLKQLKKLFNQLEKNNSLNNFHEENYILDLLQLCNFSILECYKEGFEIEFDDVFSMLKSFSQIGANKSLNGGEKLNKSDLKYLEKNYPGRDDKKILEWEINYIICKK